MYLGSLHSASIHASTEILAVSYINTYLVQILGVTRDTVLTLAREFKDELRPIMAESIKAAGMGEEKKDDDFEVTVSERDVRVEDLLNAAEVFVTGTAAEVVPVQSIGTSETPAEELDREEEESFSVKFPHGESSAGPVTTKLLEMLREVLGEKRSSEATKDWLCDVYASPEDFRRRGCDQTRCCFNWLINARQQIIHLLA